MKKTLITIVAFFSMVGIIRFAEAKLLHQYASFPERAEKAVELGLVETPQQYTGDLQTNLVLKDWYDGNFNPQDPNIEFGADSVKLIAGSTYNLSGSGISSSATSITVQSLTIPQNGYLLQDSDLSDVFYLTIEPGSRTRQEVVACTTVTQNAGGTATLSGCSRGISPIFPYTPSSTLQFVHAGGAQVIFSDPPAVFDNYVGKTASSTITGLITLASTTPNMYPAGDGVYLRFGDGGSTVTNKCIYVHNGDATPPKLCFNDSTNKWLMYNDGVSSIDVSAGGSGLTANNSPMYLSSSEIKLATSTSNYVFTLDTSVASPYPLIIATSTISNGKASGKAIEDHWNSRWNATTTKENLIVNNQATSTVSLWVGSGGTANNIDLTGGDLYVQNDVEVDDSLFVTGETFGTGAARLTTINATTTNVGTLSVFTGHNLMRATSTEINASMTGTNETTGWTYAIPGGSIGTHGTVRVTFGGTHTVVGGTNGTWLVKLGGSTICTITDGATTDTLVNYCEFSNKGSQSAQFGVLQWGQEQGDTTFRAFSIPSGASVDTSANQNLTITLDTDHASDSLSLTFVRAEVIKITQE